MGALDYTYTDVQFPAATQLLGVVARLQAIVLRYDGEAPHGHRFHEAILLAKEGCCEGHKQVIRALVGEIVAKLVKRCGLQNDLTVGRSFILMAATCRSDAWELHVQRIVDQCEAAVSTCRSPLLVRRALLEFDRQFCNGRLTEADFATQLGVSVSHLQHQLKHHTGRTFLQHLSDRRDNEALRMIRETSDTLDAIAFSVGYSGATQLRRHLRARFGLPGTAIRQGKAVPVPD